MCVCVCVCVSSVWQKLCEYARRVTDLQPAGLAFGRLKTWFLLWLQVKSLINTGSATYASHLDITKCRWGILWPGAQDGYSDAVTQGRTPPLSSHGSCKPIDEYPYCTEGAMRLG